MYLVILGALWELIIIKALLDPIMKYTIKAQAVIVCCDYLLSIQWISVQASYMAPISFVCGQHAYINKCIFPTQPWSRMGSWSSWWYLEIKWFSQGHTGSWWQCWDLYPVLPSLIVSYLQDCPSCHWRFPYFDISAIHVSCPEISNVSESE